MIEKNEILIMAKALSLNPDTVEKDYVLGWLLWGINRDLEFKKTWAFKGGTSLKKCFFETFRFSEDLDFTISQTEHLSVDQLEKRFIKIADRIYEEVGIEFFKDQFRFKIISKENGHFSAQGKIQYNGPLRRKQGLASIKLDLTTDEIIVLPTVAKKVHHPYSDVPADGIIANCYAFEEVVAEKIRALAQRARPRDLYDVVHFFRNRAMIENPVLVYNILTKKCGSKHIEVPSYGFMEKHEKLEELKSQWENMLAHQLPSLPPIESFWQDLEPFFEWLEGNLEEEKLISPLKSGEQTFQPGRVVNFRTINSVLEKIQFAAANRICIELAYKNKKKTIEPLSFRTARDGNIIFYGYERGSDQLKCFTLSKIQDVTITNLPYMEKYPVEINFSGTIIMPPIRRNKTGPR